MRLTRSLSLLATALAAIACDEPRIATSQNHSATAPVTSAPTSDGAPETNKTALAAAQNKIVKLSEKTPLDFGAAWKEIIEEEDPATQAALSKRFEETWTGQRYRWTGAMLPGLCLDAKRSCAVNTFSRQTDPHLKWLGGFFPNVTFGKKGWDTFHEKCRGQSTCVITFEATLANVRVEPDATLMLDFQEGATLEARAAREGEGWFSTKSAISIPKEKAMKNKADLRTGRPTKVPDFLRRQRTF